MATGKQLFLESEQQAEARASVAEMREWIPEEIRSLLLGVVVMDLAELDDYQQALDADKLAEEPFSLAFRTKYGDTVVKAIENNTASYDDEVEDQITEDGVWEKIRVARREDPRNIGLARAGRVRRSLIAFSIYSTAKEPAADEERLSAANSDAA